VRVPVLGCIAEDFSNILPAPNLLPIFTITSVFLKLGQPGNDGNEQIVNKKKMPLPRKQATIALCPKPMPISGSFLPFLPCTKCSPQSGL
jgi:hypothetical protein